MLASSRANEGPRMRQSFIRASNPFIHALCVALIVGFQPHFAASTGSQVTKSERELLSTASVGKRNRGPVVDGCSIYILDANQIAKENGIPECHLTDIVVDARTQVPYLKEFSTANKAKRVIPSPHYFSGNSAPWFTTRAVKQSQYWTQDVSNASIVLVDDYCFKLWWLSYIHSEKPDQLPGERLLHVYELMMLRPEWRKAKGSKHVFFQSHTGFAHGPLGDFYEKFLCETLVNSMHVVNVRASRLRCKQSPYNPDNLLIAPGSVHYHDIREFQLRERERLHNREGQNFRHERDFLLFFKGKCTPLNFTWKLEAVKNNIAQSTVNVGKLMRVHIIKAIQGIGRNVRAACTGDMGEMKEVQTERPHWEQMDEFVRSTFCLLISGDSQTSRRLPEAIMAGCIPVFPGPPYHTMPFADLVDYGKFAVFFRFKQTPWADSITIHWEIDQKDNTQRPHHPTDSEWWVPDVQGIQELIIDVADPAAMVTYLRDLNDEEVASMQQAVLDVQPQFAYMEHAEGESPSAADQIARAMCERWRKQVREPPELVEPSPVPVDRSKLNSAQRKQPASSGKGSAAGDSGLPRPQTSTSAAWEGDFYDDALLDGEGHHVVVKRDQLVNDPARAIGDKARLRRRRRQGPPVQTLAEQLGNDGRWKVGDSS